MDWFERLTGFHETDYDDTKKQLQVDGHLLRSRANGCAYGIVHLELVSLRALRERVRSGKGAEGRLKVSNLRGDVRHMHQATEFAGALFQVASQFNLLEMVSPDVRPEDGITRYQYDRTQGPACAIAAGAATIYRNYFVPVGGQLGQTHDRQLDGLAHMGAALSRATGLPTARLWHMKNGYALCREEGLTAITSHLSSVGEDGVDGLRSVLRIGVHQDVEVTDSEGTSRPIVSQAFCSALPIAYSSRCSIVFQVVLLSALQPATSRTTCSARTLAD